MLYSDIPPSFIMLFAAFIIPFLSKNLRIPVVLIAPVLTLFQIWNIPAETEIIKFAIAGFDLNPLYAHPYTHIFSTIFAIAAFAGGLFGLMQSNKLESASAFLYSGSAIGVTFSGDFITMFIYWELMAIGSSLIIFSSKMKGAMQAGMRYVIIHFMGGVILMAGIISHIVLSGDSTIVAFNADTSILFPEYSLDANAITMWLILIGVLINAATPPLSSWLPDSYPKSSPFGAVFLSAFTTKTSIFVLLTIFTGAEILIYIGLFMVFYGLIYSVFENDIRKILSYSIINQVGFMMVGVGIGTQMALSGVAAHAFSHIIYKALLFMTTGSVIYMTNETRCSHLGGLYKNMRFTAICSIIGVLTIAAFPLTTSFVTKSMITYAAAKEELELAWMLLMAASAGMIIYTGIIKFPWFTFLQEETGPKPKDPPLNMKIAMAFLAALCIAPALPNVAEVTLFKMLPEIPKYKAYTIEHVVAQLQLLAFAALGFFIALPLLKRKDKISLDFDWIYRNFAKYIISALIMMAKTPITIVRIISRRSLRYIAKIIYHIHYPEGILARNWSMETTITWTAATLGIYLILYYI